MDWYSWILFFVIMAYSIVVLSFYFSWKPFSHNVPAATKYSFFTIIVAARNEALNIENCLRALSAQAYPSQYFEVIIVNDNSLDETPDIVRSFIENHKLGNFRLINLEGSPGKGGKKQAILAGINNSKGDYIVTTDADCLCGNKWLMVINSWLKHYNPVMLIGPVQISPATNFFGKLQALEFCSLSGITAGATAIGSPVMCNGANLVYCRKTFSAVDGFTGNNEYASGDDVFLMHKFKKIKNRKILFMDDADAIVRTSPVNTIRGFFRQRLRWASKASGYSDPLTIIVALLVALTNLLAVSGIALAIIFTGKYLAVAAGFLLVKALIDYYMLWKVTGFFSNRKLMWLFPVLSVIYPFYVIISAAGSFARPESRHWR